GGGEAGGRGCVVAAVVGGVPGWGGGRWGGGDRGGRRPARGTRRDRRRRGVSRVGVDASARGALADSGQSGARTLAPFSAPRRRLDVKLDRGDQAFHGGG